MWSYIECNMSILNPLNISILFMTTEHINIIVRNGLKFLKNSNGMQTIPVYKEIREWKADDLM